MVGSRATHRLHRPDGTSCRPSKNDISLSVSFDRGGRCRTLVHPRLSILLCFYIFADFQKRTTSVQFNSHPQPVITHIRRLSDSDRIVRELGHFLTRLFSCHRFRFVILFIILLDKFNRVRKNVVKVVKSATVLVIESLKFQLNFFGRTKTEAKGTSDVTKA